MIEAYPLNFYSRSNLMRRLMEIRHSCGADSMAQLSLRSDYNFTNRRDCRQSSFVNFRASAFSSSFE